MGLHINLSCHLLLTLDLSYCIPTLEVKRLENFLSGQGGGGMWDSLTLEPLLHIAIISLLKITPALSHTHSTLWTPFIFGL